MRDLLQPYNPDWPSAFRLLQAQLHLVLRDAALKIEHVGSTAIPGMPAKPILDLDIIIPGLDKLATVTATLQEAGYLSRGNQGIPGRYAFRQIDGTVPKTKPVQQWMTHHLYVCLADSLALRNHLRFRDALLADLELAGRYGRMKWDLANLPGMDRETYTRAKTRFVLEVLAGQGFDERELAEIADANK